jgi:hypothetical protein
MWYLLGQDEKLMKAQIQQLGGLFTYNAQLVNFDL